MTKWILAFTFLIHCGCATPPPEFVSHVKEIKTANGTLWTLAPYSGKKANKRILLIHGLTKNHSQWYSDAPAFLVNHLWHTDWEVIFIDLPHTTDPAPYVELKNLLTPSYRDAFQLSLQNYLTYADENIGTVDYQMVGGISWGGLHSLMAASIMPQFQSYFALIPVTDISALTGFEQYHLDNFSPINEVPNLSSKPGYISWGGQDAAVNPANQTEFVQALQTAGAPVVPAFYPTYSHQTTNLMVYKLFDFIDERF